MPRIKAVYQICQRVRMQASFLAFASFYQTTKLLDENLPLLKLITCCVEAIYAVNAAPWQPDEETQMLQTNKQTDRLL